MREMAQLLKSGAAPDRETPRGSGEGVLLIPGLAAGDYTLSFLRHYLSLAGYKTYASGIVSNVLPADTILPSLEEKIDLIYAETGKKVSIVGHSLGGAMGKLLSDRKPDKVQQVIGLGPVFNQYIGISPSLFCIMLPIAAYDIARFGREILEKELGLFKGLSKPAKVPLSSIYSKSDGVLTFKSCMRGDSENYEVNSTHVGMAVNKEVFKLVAELLHKGYKAPKARIHY